MSGGRQRNNPVDAALARLADLAGRGVKPARMERQVDAVLAGWESGPGAGDPDVVVERLDILHENLANGVSDAAEQLADVDRGDAAALRHADAVHAALAGALSAIGRAREAQRGKAAAAAEPFLAAPVSAVAKPMLTVPVTTLAAVTIVPLTEQNPQALHHVHPEEVRADVERAPLLATAEASQPKAKTKKPRKSSRSKDAALSLALA